jgi:hypothetical protein
MLCASSPSAGKLLGVCCAAVAAGAAAVGGAAVGGAAVVEALAPPKRSVVFGVTEVEAKVAGSEPAARVVVRVEEARVEGSGVEARAAARVAVVKAAGSAAAAMVVAGSEGARTEAGKAEAARAAEAMVEVARAAARVAAARAKAMEEVAKAARVAAAMGAARPHLGSPPLLGTAPWLVAAACATCASWSKYDGGGGGRVAGSCADGSVEYEVVIGCTAARVGDRRSVPGCIEQS